MPDDDDTDPRNKGSNYSTGWGSDPKPPTYYHALAILAAMTKKFQEQSRDCWEGDMACRNVRLAYTGVEKAKALNDLDEWLSRH